MFHIHHLSRWGPRRDGRLLAMNAVASSYTSAGDLVASFVFVRYTKLYLARKRVTAPKRASKPLSLKAASCWCRRVEDALYTTWGIVTAIPCSRRAKIHCQSSSLMQSSCLTGSSQMAFCLPREAISRGRALVHLTRTVWGTLIAAAAPPEREIPLDRACCTPQEAAASSRQHTACGPYWSRLPAAQQGWCEAWRAELLTNSSRDGGGDGSVLNFAHSRHVEKESAYEGTVEDMT